MPAANHFDLHLYVTGLALFVPEGAHTMHVLLPRSDTPLGNCAGGSGTTHVHEAKLYWDGGRIEFGALRWTPPASTPAATNPKLPPNVYKIDPQLPRRFVEHRPQEDVAGHLVLRAGAAAAVGETLQLNINGKPSKGPRLTNSLLWIVRQVPGAELKLEFESVKTLESKPSGVTLYPNAKGIIRLHLMNLPIDEHRPYTAALRECPPNEEHHFHMFGVFFPGHALPRFQCIPGRRHRNAPRGYGRPPQPPQRKNEKGAHTAKVIYTCMIAQAELG